MFVRIATFVLVCALILCGCGGQEATEAPAQDAAPQIDHALDLDPDDPTLLTRPFTAEQIREEWIVGFTLTMQRTTPEGENTERWTVVGADTEGAEIEFAVLDAAGNVAGEPRVARSRWVELRNHASFPAASATRKDVVRGSPLGMLDGWLYTVRDDAAGSTTEFFFADSLPGAPVHMREMRGEEVVMELVQIERSRPGEN
jgi:hypothetical protein